MKASVHQELLGKSVGNAKPASMIVNLVLLKGQIFMSSGHKDYVLLLYINYDHATLCKKKKITKSLNLKNEVTQFLNDLFSTPIIYGLFFPSYFIRCTVIIGRLF